MTNYEWVLETLDPVTGDILEDEFFDTLQETGLTPIRLRSYDRGLSLVVTKGNPIDGSEWKSWATVEDMKLPVVFPCGRPVPKKYKEEFERWLQTS